MPAGVEVADQRETAAVLAVGDPVALCGLTAAALWRLPAGADPGGPVQLVIPADRVVRRPGLEVRRARALAQRDIRRIKGLPVTSPERTLLDIAMLDTVSERELDRALDEALALRITSVSKLTTLLAERHGRPGRARLAGLLAQRQGSTATRSEAEERFLALIRAAGLPTPVMQAAIAGFTVDAYWPQARFVVEIDGYQWHTVLSNFNRDRRKDRALQLLGIQVSRVTWGQMEGEAMQLIAEIATTLALRMRAVAS
jgi:very-short-patch-repair endonuclease